ncbi:MAG: hypothetical protein WCG67_02015, partial [Ferruginibacter sp.]
TADGEILKGFSIDNNTVAIAEIQKKKVLIRLANKPTFIYYGWKPFSDANLVNSEHLPASTFKIKVD